MSGLVFTLRAEPDQRLDLSGLTAGRLRGLGEREIAELAVGTTRERLRVGDVFALRFGDPAAIRFEGGSERFDRVGEGQEGGSITVEGDVGQLAGRAMAGGAIAVEGSSGPFAGSGMSGGTLRIAGDAGDDLAGPGPGEMAGMRGGTLLVGGSAGHRAGDRMRRGVLLVAGSAGDHAGARMIAGTLLVGGPAGASPGFLMKRGTILLPAGAGSLSPTFCDNGPADLLVLALMARAFGALPFPLGRFTGGPMRRLSGDTAVLGLGEIFLPLD